MIIEAHFRTSVSSCNKEDQHRRCREIGREEDVEFKAAIGVEGARRANDQDLDDV